MPRLLVFAEEAELRRTWIRRLRDQPPGARVKVRQATSVAILHRTLDRDAADVVILDVSGARGSRLDLAAEVRHRHPNQRVLLVIDPESSGSEALHEALSSSSVDFVRSHADTWEVWQRLRRLARTVTDTESGTPSSAAISGSKQARERENTPGGTSSHPRTTDRSGTWAHHLVPDLRNRTGRLDARKVAVLFGIPLAEVARIAGRQLSTVHKTPASPSLQQPLSLFERIAAALLPLAGSEEGLRMWLNAPNRDLAGHAPIALLSQGQGEIVAELLEDALVGQPG